MSDDGYKRYARKPTFTPMKRWVPGMDMDGVSISAPDKQNGSPLDGDMIARNPDNPIDRWLVAKAYFEKHYEGTPFEG